MIFYVQDTFDRDNEVLAAEGMRFRLFLDGCLADEAWGLLPADVEAVATRQATLTRDASTWMVEIFNPAAEPEHAYQRWGTDASTMEDPVAVRQ